MTKNILSFADTIDHISLFSRYFVHSCNLLNNTIYDFVGKFIISSKTNSSKFLTRRDLGCNICSAKSNGLSILIYSSSRHVTPCHRLSQKYTLSKANLDLGKNMLLLENPQFLSNHNETLSK